MDINSEMGMIYFCYPLVTRSDFLTRTRLRRSDNLVSAPGHSCYNCNTTKTSVALPKRHKLTGVQCQPRSKGTIGILTDPWRPILRCYYDFVQWIILLGHEVCAIGFEKITRMSSFCQVAKSE